ncbi:MAG TPA: efflux RND transporter permease subunit, partial [Planctomycetota bacterium]|nr:efflux RND transporter permease subunit [Planctomycetota bacterium]
RVRAAGLDLGALIARMSADNFALPLGEVTDGGRRVLLRSDMRFKSKQEIEAFPIEGGLVLGDVGRVIDAKSVRNRLFRMDGTYAYFGEVQKESQANVVEVCHRVQAALEELHKDPRLAGEFKFLVFFDQGKFIENSVEQLRDTAYSGGWLSVLILFLFLPRVRLTLCMALAIPVSVLFAIAWVFFSGGTFNVLTMAGITLAMGMLVDNAVVVVENIKRLRDLGLPAQEAASRGTREVALALILSTLTTVVVFLPMIFMGENPTLRIMFGALGLPLCISLIASLLAALVFLPAIIARVIGPRPAWVERIAGGVAPIAGIPGSIVGWLMAGLRMAGFGLVFVLHWIERGVLWILGLRLAVPSGLFFLAAAGFVVMRDRARVAEGYARLTGAESSLTLGEALFSVAYPLFMFGCFVFAVRAEFAKGRRYRVTLRVVLALGILALAVLRGTTLLGSSGLDATYSRITGNQSDLSFAFVQVIGGTLLALGILLVGTKMWSARTFAAPAPPARWRAADTGLVQGLITLNQRLLGWTLANRFWASIASLVVLASVIIPQTQMKMAAFGEDENTSRVRVEVDLENNFTLAQAEEEMAHYEQYFQAHKEQYAYEHMACRFDKDGGRVDAYWEGSRSREQRDAVVADLRKNLHPRPGHDMRIGGDDSADARNKNLVTFRLTGPESDGLSRLGAEAVKLLEQIPGLIDVKSPLADAPEQVRVVFDSDLAHSLGVSPENALQNVAWALSGWQLPRFQEPGREVPLIIEYDEEQAAGLSTLRDLEIRGGKSSVPLTTFSTIEYARASRTIERFDGKTAFQITARVEDPMRQRELSDLGLATLRTLDFPRGYSVAEDDLVSSRQDSEMKEIYAALLLSVVLVFLLMGVLSESFLLPISILFTIPFAIVGALWTMYLTHTAMDSIGWIGVIILVGVVVSHGIVLVDRIHHLRNRGIDRTVAIMEGSANRVRPVLMTALCSVAGLLPMAMTEPPGEGIDYRALATCVAGGLAVSTISTLWVVPLAYALLDDLRVSFTARVVHWRTRAKPVAPVTLPSVAAREAQA